MGGELLKFFGSLTGASLLRILLTMALTTASVMAAYPGVWTYRLIAGCNAITVAGALWMEYRNYQNRR
jgi:hypothetical protein